jgi:hypothetical protein
MTAVEFELRVTQRQRCGGKAEGIALRQDLLMRDERIVRAILPRDMVEFEVGVRTRTHDDLPESMRREDEREIEAREWLASGGLDLRTLARYLSICGQSA